MGRSLLELQQGMFDPVLSGFLPLTLETAAAASRAFCEVRDYVEMKVRTLLTRRKRRRKSSVGWQRWSNEYLYGVLRLFWDWKIHPLQNVEAYL